MTKSDPINSDVSPAIPENSSDVGQQTSEYVDGKSQNDFDFSVDKDSQSTRDLLGAGIVRNGSSASISNELRERQSHKYDLSKMIARGGMGAVLDVKDHCIGRHVAMKVMLKDQQSPEGVLRFIEEAQVTGQLEHPAIVPVHELGVDPSGTVFYTMKYVQGRTLKDVLEKIRDGDIETIEKYSLVELLSVFLRVCDAIAFAHSRKVIHRDLKPENIMLGEYGEVLVVDWGLAKLMGESELEQNANASSPNKSLYSDRQMDISDLTRTMDGQVMGTPAFMPPEQATGRTLDIDYRSDIYALGGVLYNILTLSPPVRGQSLSDILNKVALGDITHPTKVGKDKLKNEETPVKLLHCQKLKVPESLAAVAMKALAKRRENRYPVVQEMQHDVQSYLNGFATRAENASLLRQCVLLFNRKKREAAVVTGAFLVLIAITAGFLIRLNQKKNEAQAAERLAETARGEAELSRAAALVSAEKATAAEGLAKREASNAQLNFKIAEQRAYFSDMLLLRQTWAESNIGQFEKLLNRYRDRVDLRNFEWSYWNRTSTTELVSLPGTSNYIHRIEFSPDGTLLAVPSKDHKLILYEVATGRELKTFSGHSGPIEAVSFSPDGMQMATGSLDNTAKIWDVSTGENIATLTGHADEVTNVLYSRDGTQLATASFDSTVKLWDTATWELTHTLARHTRKILSMSFNRDGTRLASASWDRTVKIWDTLRGEVTKQLKDFRGDVNAVTFSPNGDTLAVATVTDILLFEANSWREVLKIEGQHSVVLNLAFSPDGKHIALANRDRTLRIWDVATGQETLAIKDHQAEVTGTSFSPDGTKLVSYSVDQSVKMWDAVGSPESLILHGNKISIRCACFSPDGKSIVAANWNGLINVWDSFAGQKRQTFDVKSSVSRMAFSPDGKRLVLSENKTLVKIRDAETFAVLLELNGHTDEVLSVAFSPDGSKVISAGRDDTVKLWDASTGKEIHTIKEHRNDVVEVVFSPNAKQFASASLDQSVRIWATESGQQIAKLTGHSTQLSTLAFNPNGTRLASGDNRGQIIVWDVTAQKSLLVFEGHNDRVKGLAFSIDGSRLASASGDGTAKLWDTQTGTETLTLEGLGDSLNLVAFSPDGMRLMAAGNSGTVELWDARHWSNEQRFEVQACGYLQVHRARVNSLEELEAYIEDDKTLNEGVRQQALEWSELFWKNR